MFDKIKALGLAFVAMLVFGSVLASAAHAERERVHIDANPANLTAQNQFSSVQHIHKLKLKPADLISVECKEATLEGTSEEASVQEQTPSDITVTAFYGSCQFLGAATTVDMNGCKFTITGETQPSPTSPSTLAEAKVSSCTASKVIQITVGNLCTIDIGEQIYLKKVTFVNTSQTSLTSEKDVDANANVSGIVFQETSSPGLGCPDGNNFQGSNAQFTGETTVRAFKDEGFGAEDSINSHKFKTLKCGAQVGLFAD